MNSATEGFMDSYGLALVSAALLVVLLLPHFAPKLGLEDKLDDMARQSAARYGLDLDAIQRHHFTADIWHTSLFTHAECPICLQTGKTSWSLLLKGARKCGHFFCTDCAQELLRTSGSCAICRTRCTGLVSIPDPQNDPVGWFKAIDAKNDGKLDRNEVLNVLRVLCAEEHSSGALQEKIDELWPVWDRDQDGYISLEEMMDPTFGLLVFIINTTAAFADNAEHKATVPAEDTAGHEKQS